MNSSQPWQRTLRRGEEITFKYAGFISLSRFNTGDSVQVRRVPVRDLEAGDVVLCEISDEICLREVVRVHDPSRIEVLVPHGIGISQFIHAVAYQGKVLGPEDVFELPAFCRGVLRLFGARRWGLV